MNVFARVLDPAFVDNKCPDDIIRTPDPGENTATVAWVGPSAKTKTSEDATVTCEPPSGSQFAGGEKTVECKATQPGGGEATCSFKVAVCKSLLNAFQAKIMF